MITSPDVIAGAPRRPWTRVTATFAAALLALLAVVALGTATARPAAAAPAGGSGGWIRLAHLSPDTEAVDVTLTALSGKKRWLKLDDVGYGDVSAYRKVPAGSYIAAMTPAGTGSSTPVISQAVTVKDDYAYTVAAVGKKADLKGTVLSDDLRAPKKGNAKIRLIQASTVAPSVTVTAVGGPVLARNAAFASSTGYAEVPQGIWTVKVTPTEGSAAAVSAKVTAMPGSVNTIVVLDGKDGAVTLKTIKDASGTTTMPKKSTGVATGGGGTAGDIIGASTRTESLGVAAGTALLTSVSALLVARRRRNHG